MEDIASASTAQAAAEPRTKMVPTDLDGRIGVLVGGKLVAVLEVTASGAKLIGADGSGDGGKAKEFRTTFTCQSLDEFRKLADPKANWMVAALRGRFSAGGDLTYGLRVIRAMRTTMPVDWSDQQAEQATGQGG
jgi:hypothetical protein